MKIDIKKGSTSQLIEIFISDSSSTTGAGLTSVAFGDITAFYYRSGAAGEVELASLQGMTLGTWVTEGFIEIDATNLPGYYQLGLPDAALLTGTEKVNFMLKGATDMAPLPIEIQLVDNVEKDSFDIVNDASFGNAKLVRSTTPANTLNVDGSGDVTAENMRGTDGANTTTPPTVNEVRDGILDDATRFSGADIGSIDSRLPAALVSGKMNSDTTAISGNATSADNLEQSTLGIVVGAAIAGTLSNTQMTTNLTETTNDHYNGGVLIFVTGNLAGQRTAISDYDGATKKLTFTATTEAPAIGDAFVIV